MKTKPYSSIFSPFYVLLSGSLGGAFALFLFTWNYPKSPDDKVGQAFVNAQPFYIWVFLFAVLCCLLTVLILPAWALLVELLKKRTVIGAEKKERTILALVLEAIFLTVIVFALLRFMSSIQSTINLTDYVPQGHNARMMFMYVFTFLATLPALLGIMLIHGAAGELSAKIDAAGQTESQLFPLIAELISFRNILQNYLGVLGIVLSMIPITTAGLRAILITLNPENEQNFPITNAILFGLVFTVLLLLIYIPTHLALTEVSRKLRDHCCPRDSLNSLKQDIEQRKPLDDLLQTNIGITQNLKMGLITLAPLATSLLSSLFQVNITL